MASQATHVRFARDLAKALLVRDVGSYYSGCVYPDSRYVTGAQRETTHTLSVRLDDMSDFQKGCFTHVLYDKLVGPTYLDRSPWPGEPVTDIGPKWVYLSAAKLIEDQMSFDALEDLAILRTVSCPTPAPNGEDANLLERYYHLLRALYRDRPTVPDYLSLFHDLRLPDAVAQQVRVQTETLRGKPDVIQAIHDAYAPAVNVALKQIRQG